MLSSREDSISKLLCQARFQNLWKIISMENYYIKFSIDFPPIFQRIFKRFSIENENFPWKMYRKLNFPWKIKKMNGKFYFPWKIKFPWKNDGKFSSQKFSSRSRLGNILNTPHPATKVIKMPTKISYYSREPK